MVYGRGDRVRFDEMRSMAEKDSVQGIADEDEDED